MIFFLCNRFPAALVLCIILFKILVLFYYKKLNSRSLSFLPNSHQALLDAGYDPNYMLHPWVRRSYDDERKSALFFTVSNNDVPSAKLLLEAGAMANQDPVKCLQVCVCPFKRGRNEE